METVKISGLVDITIEISTKNLAELREMHLTIPDIYTMTIRAIADDDREIADATVIMVEDTPSKHVRCPCSHAEIFHAGHMICSFCDCGEFRPAE